eukprot:2956500-Prorocentrum_lima.AAC.1
MVAVRSRSTSPVGRVRTTRAAARSLLSVWLSPTQGPPPGSSLTGGGAELRESSLAASSVSVE